MEIYIFIHFQQGHVYSARKHHYYMIDSWYLLAKFKMTTCTMHLFPCSCYPPSCQLDKVPTVELRQKSNRPQYVLSIHFQVTYSIKYRVLLAQTQHWLKMQSANLSFRQELDNRIKLGMFSPHPIDTGTCVEIVRSFLGTSQKFHSQSVVSFLVEGSHFGKCIPKPERGTTPVIALQSF